MGTTRDSKASARSKADDKPAKKKTTKKVSAKAKTLDKPAKKKTATKAAAAKPVKTRAAAAAVPAPKKRAVKAAAPEAAPARRAAESPRKAAEPARKPARATAEAPVAPAPPPPPPPPAPARDPREERRARLEEKLAMRSAALREQQQQRTLHQPQLPLAAVAPAAQAAPAGAPQRDARGPAMSRPRDVAPPHQRPAPAAPAPAERAAPRPDLPFDPTSFSAQRAAAPQHAAAAAPAPRQDETYAEGDAASEGGGRRRRRRRRRRRGGGDAGWEQQPGGPQPPQAQAGAPPAAPPRPQFQQPQAMQAAPHDGDFADGDEGFEGGGRRRRRRRRRRRGGGGEGQPEPQSHAAPPQQQPRFSPPPRQQAPQPRFDDDFSGGGGGRRGRRRRRGREFDGPLPWDPQREAPAVNILPDRDPFSELVSIDPEERIDLETDTEEMSMRVVDLITPFGKGQRGLIVAPPKTGKTTLLLQLARAISENHPEVELIVMLVDERPEEVTAFRRAGYGEVLASSNDEPTHRHLKLTQHVLDVAKRRVLDGKDVCILLDSITRMARAHNVSSSGHKTLSGGLDSRALERPKRFFGAARKILNGGSLTILGTALIDTGSRMDEVIFQEFKGTGNSELQLDRRLAERRIWPAIDIQRSGTRKEEKLFEPAEYEGIIALRRALSGKPPAEAMQLLLARLAQYKTNREFLLDVARKAATAL